MVDLTWNPIGISGCLEKAVAITAGNIAVEQAAYAL
jgi:hypothetical protein